MGDILDMDKAMSEDAKFVDFVAGNHVLEGSIPISHRYGGHQFGLWVSCQAIIAYKTISNYSCFFELKPRQDNWVMDVQFCWENTRTVKENTGSSNLKVRLISKLHSTAEIHMLPKKLL